ncbi:MAG: glycoside hydrolase family 3 N-terminal domain-containing protein [Planctomycetota bacterium]
MSASPRVPGGIVVPSIRLPEDYGRIEEFERLLTEAGVAGFIVYGGDEELTPPFLARLRKTAGRPILIMADYERGAGQHVTGMPELPPMMSIGATGSAESSYMAGKITALSARAVGVNVVLAPVLDVLSRATNPIAGSRSFSDDPDLVTRLGLAFIEGIQEEGVLACAKHYPGHGDTALDSHADLPRVDAPPEVLSERELVPFRAAARAGVGMMMTAHAVYPAMDPAGPATFSAPIVSGLLKDRWGYGGLVITDALNMEGAKRGGAAPEVSAVNAGVDLLLYPEDPWAAIETLRRAMEDGTVSEESVRMSAAKAALVAADLAFDAPVRKEVTRGYAFAVERIARESLTVGGDPDRLLDRLAGRPGRVCGLIVDDDGYERRARAFDARRDDFTGGVLHVTREGTGFAGDVAEVLREADVVVMGLMGDVKAWKERTGLGPELSGFAGEVLAEHGKKTLAVVFGTPSLVLDLPVRNVVFAYGDVPVTRRAALDDLFDGGAMPGRLPAAAGPAFPRGIGKGVFPTGG